MTSTDASPARLEIIDKADALIRLLADEGERSATDIATELGEPTSSVYRLLTSLTALDFVEPGVRRGTYRLGIDLMRLGGVVEDRLNLRDAVAPELRGLLEATGLTVFLCIRAGERAVCIERLEGRNVRSLALVLGQSLPLHRGAAPRAILANLPAGERATVCELLRDDPEYPPTPDDAPDSEAFAQVRADGYALSDGDVTPGIASLGAPVRNHRGEVVAAISVSGLRAHTLDPELAVVDLVRAATLRASESLGFREGEH
ncbi:IclR family transcriptional regulator [Gulosibacter faecalis]|uniref:IclR family transcriptional regulator n=1 Tax=Gulosibacter faecalis TaxID=272240 RepID=A0ABW5UWR5_9MICO|nr:IclR family transcriptional regulator [Gulosibacter faecalis]